MKKVLLPAMLILFTICYCTAQSISSIPGWTSSSEKYPAIASTQTISKQDNLMIYQIRDRQTNSQENSSWFSDLVKTDLQKENWKEKIKGALNSSSKINVYASEVKDTSGKSWYVLYMAYNLGEKQIRLSRVKGSADKDFFKLYASEASQHFGRLYQQDTDAGKKDANAEAVSIPPSKAKPAIVKKPIRTTGPPATMAQIHSMIMHLEYESGMGGGIYPVYNAYMLFKNGDIYKYPELCLADLDIAASKITEQMKWGTWKQNGTSIDVSWPTEKAERYNTTWEKKSLYNILPATKNELLNGSFSSISGGGNTALGGDVMVMAASDISFNKEGKFTLEKVVGVSSSRSVWENTSANSNHAGTYLLDGYSIELKYYNGRTERSFFYFYPDSKDAFGIGQSVYLAKKK